MSELIKNIQYEGIGLLKIASMKVNVLGIHISMQHTHKHNGCYGFYVTKKCKYCFVVGPDKGDDSIGFYSQ